VQHQKVDHIVAVQRDSFSFEVFVLF